MKKIVSLMALCAVLLGAVMMVTGCGSKPEKGTVWKVVEITVAGKSQEIPHPMYYCFHSDGNAYSATKMGEKLFAASMGTYTIEAKKVTIGGVSFDYTMNGNTMTLTGTLNKVSGSMKLQKSSDYTEKQIKDAVVAVPSPSK